MAANHLLESHPQKQKAIEYILAGKSVRWIAANLDPTVDFQAIQRYRKTIVKPALTRSAAFAKVLGIDKSIDSEQVTAALMDVTKKAIQAAPVVDLYLSRIAQHRETVDRNVLAAEADGDGRTVAALLSTDMKGLELDARLTGRLDASAGGNTTIYVMTPQCSVSFAAPGEAKALGPVVEVKADPD